MPRELEPWGGELQMPRVLRRLLRRPGPPGDSQERTHERRNPEATTMTPLENIDRALFGAFSQFHPGNRPPGRR